MLAYVANSGFRNVNIPKTNKTKITLFASGVVFIDNFTSFPTNRHEHQIVLIFYISHHFTLKSATRKDQDTVA